MWGDGKIGVSWCLCGGQRTTCGNSSAMLSPRNLGPQHQQQLPVCSELSHWPETFAWSSTVILLSLLVV